MVEKFEAATAPLDVLNPRGRDSFASYAEGIPGPEDSGHPPVNFHAIAAATGGRFHRTPSTIPREAPYVLVLLPRRLSRALRAVRSLKRSGRTVLVTWKECGSHQIERQLRRPLARFWLERILAWTDARLAVSPACLAFFAARRDRAPLLVLPTPYPLEEPRWSFERPLLERNGILVGTRDWNARPRRHEAAVRLALRVAERVGCRVTVLNVDGGAGERRLRSLGGNSLLRIVRGPLPYRDYLSEMASHRLVLQRDHSGVPGQVAGDALLCGIPCMGGSGMVDRIAFGHLPGAGSDDAVVAETAVQLLTDDEAWTGVVERARRRAAARLSFSAFRAAWREAAATLSP